MAGKQLEPSAWKAEVADCGKKWRSLTPQQREPYICAALEEQGLRAEAALQPMPSKHSMAHSTPRLGEAGFDAAAMLNRKARSHVAKDRLRATYREYKDCDVWKNYCCGLSDADGALRLDLVNLHDDHLDICEAWSNFASESRDSEIADADLESSLHHTTCHSLYGQCKRTMNLARVARFVQHMGILLADGAWAEAGLRISERAPFFRYTLHIWTSEFVLALLAKPRCSCPWVSFAAPGEQSHGPVLLCRPSSQEAEAAGAYPSIYVRSRCGRGGEYPSHHSIGAADEAA